MPLPKKSLAEFLEILNREGAGKLDIAPLKKPPSGLPPGWAEALSEDDPRSVIVERIWAPARGFMPLTIKILEERLQGIGLASTSKRPFSLIYLFKSGNEHTPYRGLSPAPVKRPESGQVPPELIEFSSRVHDGWFHLYSEGIGPLPSARWFYIASQPSYQPPREINRRKFLVIMEDHLGSCLGLDLSSKPAQAIVLREGDPLEPFPTLGAALDGWTSWCMENFSKVKAGGKPGPKPKTKASPGAGKKTRAR